jgi:DNA-binding transcriptional ArsR family regulator
MAWPDSLDANLLKAMAHPLRARLLERVTDRGEASPVELARELDEPLPTVSHHMRVLRDLGCVELTRTEPRRGAVEHYYRPVLRPVLDDRQWTKLPRSVRRGLAAQLLQRVWEEASAAAASGGFDDATARVNRLPLKLDEEGRRELSAALNALVAEAEAIQERSQARVGEGGEAEGSELAVVHFATAPEGATPTGTAKAPRARRRRAQPPR